MTVVLDSSAVVAVILGEADAEVFAAAMRQAAGDLVISGPSLVEACIVVESRQGPAAVQDLRQLLTRAEVEVVAFDETQATAAVTAWRRFGKGRHPASLNLGGCFSYAVAKALGAELLFKGQDFSQTDIGSAL